MNTSQYMCAMVLASVAGWASDARAADDGQEPNRDASTTSTSTEGRPERGMNDSVSLLANLGYAYSAGTGLGLSGRYQHTVVPDGVLQTGAVRDDIGIEGALDYYHYSWELAGYSWSYNEFALTASAVWNFWFSEQFAVYPRLGIGYGFGSWSDNSGLASPSGYGGLTFVGGVGVLYELDVVTLRAELNNGSLGVGAAISL